MSTPYYNPWAACGLRTRIPVPPAIERPEPRRCPYCGARLARDNRDAVCAPCLNAGKLNVGTDADAPLCACGCGARTLREIRSHGGRQLRTGPYQRFVYGHHSRLQRKEAAQT